MGNVPAHVALGGCGCKEGAAVEASCESCETCSATPRICGLGNGLLDYLDRASGRFESHFFRMRTSACSCDSPCGPACDAFDGGADSSMFSDTAHGSQNSVIQHHSHAPQAHPESWQPSQGGSSERLNESPVPVPIPDPIASPPMPHSTPVPAPRAGNPFKDEARSFRIQENLEPSSKIVYSLRSPSKSGLGTVKSDYSKADLSRVEFAKVDVKPVPKHLLRGRTPEKAFDSPGIDGQMHTLQSEVIPATSVSPPTSNKIQFAR